MTLRARLAVGLAAICFVLLVPLVLAVKALRTSEATARALAQEEFAASLLLGRLRERVEDLRMAENALLFVHDEASRIRTEQELEALASLADSLDRFNLGEAAVLRTSVDSLRRVLPLEYETARSGAAPIAEAISTERVLPRLRTTDLTVVAAERTIRDRTRDRVAAAADATDAAQRSAAGALLVAVLLALAIAIWLMRSISRPVTALEQGMRAVAGGDFAHRLPFSSDRSDEFGRLAASYESMSRQLAELEKLRAEFISVASHELKTPINVIIGYLELIREGVYGDAPPKQLGILATIERQAQSLTRLVRRLLDISRFEAGGGRIDPRPLDLLRFVEGLEATFNVLAVQREVRFDVIREGGLPAQVTWDEDRMNEVLGNLLSNAFKFTPRGGSVALGLRGEEGTVNVTVADTGAGIPAEQLPHIFRKFYQADNQAASAVRGTGLGLAIAKEIVEAHKGTITVESTVGSGTVFTLELPIRVPSAHDSGKFKAMQSAPPG